MRGRVISKADRVAAALAVAGLLILFPSLPADAAEVVGGTTPTAPCTQDASTGALACLDGSRVGGDGASGPYQLGYSSSAGGLGNATGNMAIGKGSSVGMGGQGANGTAGGSGGVGGSGGGYNLAFGAGSSAGNGGKAGDGSAGGTGGDGGAGGNYNIALGDGSEAGNGADGKEGCCGFKGTSGTAGTDNNVAIGRNAKATGGGSVVLGAGSTDAGLANVVSVGSASQQRRIVNVAAGVAATDAANVGQLTALGTSLNANLGGVAAWLGGGAAYSGGVFTAPTFAVQGNSYGNVGAALSAIDTQLTAIKGRADLAVYYDDASKASLTLGGGSGSGSGSGGTSGGTQVAGVADGTAADHAVNKGQMDAGDAAAIDAAGNYTDTREAAIRTDMATADANVLSSAKAHADSGDAATLAAANGHTDNREAAIRTDMATADANVLSSARAHADSGDATTLQSARSYADGTASQAVAAANSYTDSRFEAVDLQFDGLRREMDDRFTRQDRRIDRMGAMSSAMLNMAVNAAGSQSNGGRVSVGAGFQGSEKALSIGYGRKLGARGSFSLGGAFSGSEKSGGIGFGVDL